LAIASLTRVEVEKQLLGDGDKCIVAYVARFALHDLPQQQTGSFMLLGVAERLE